MAAAGETRGLWDKNDPSGRRVVVTGQVGVDKKVFLEQVVTLAQKNNQDVQLYNVGDMMYAEAPDVVPGRILDLPLARLNSLRRAVFKDIIAQVPTRRHAIINTHATFRWKHGLFPAFDHDQIQRLEPSLFITLVDNVDAVHSRLVRDHDINHSLKDLMVWREEEIIATEILANFTSGHNKFVIMARNPIERAAKAAYRIIFEPARKKVYPSFPMTHVMDLPDTLADIDAFRAQVAEHFTVFDPGDVDEMRLHLMAIQAAEKGQKVIQVPVLGETLTFDVSEVMTVAGDIHGQIYARDFKLIEQADMIISYIPELPTGKPGLSSGVERELQHAYESTKEAYVIWRPRTEPSPFITETATRVFRSTDEAMHYFQERNYIGPYQRNLGL